MNKIIYKQYAELEARKKEIELKQGELKMEMITEMKQELPEGKNGVDTDFGSFTLAGKKIYKYSKNYEAQDKKLKKLRAEEVAKGIATVISVTEYITFRPIVSASADGIL
jgi:hypothetical protein